MRTLLRALWAEGENVIVLFSLMTLANICQFVSTSSKPDHISIEWLLTITLALQNALGARARRALPVALKLGARLPTLLRGAPLGTGAISAPAEWPIRNSG